MARDQKKAYEVYERDAAAVSDSLEGGVVYPWVVESNIILAVPRNKPLSQARVKQLTLGEIFGTPATYRDPLPKWETPKIVP